MHGYLHYFPFLQDDIRLITTNRTWTPGLYQGVAFQNNPRIMYIGMQDQFYTFTMFDAQAWWARDVILERITLPSKAEMQKHSAKWEEREGELKTDEDMIWFQGDYTQAQPCPCATALPCGHWMLGGKGGERREGVRRNN